jgi:serine/threonine protein kinase
MNGMDKQAHYQITEERGKGIFGAFFRATDLKNQQDISLHALYPHLTAEPGVMGMLHDAAQTVKGLDHPNLVPVLGFEPKFLQGVTLLQRMPGGSLADLLNTRQRPDPTRAEAMIMQLSTAMAYLHRNQIVLHGLHPSAIHFDELGVARLANVVVAKLLSMAGADDMLPMRQSLASSPYCAPELRQGGKGTYSTDIYSLGIIFYEILRGVSIEAQAEPALGLGEDWLQGIEARWQPVLWQCLLPDPQDRFQNAEALFEAIKSAAGQRQAQGFKPASMFKPDGSARPFFRPLGAGQAPGQVVRSSEGATPPIVAQPSSGAKQAGQELAAGGVASAKPVQGQAMDTSWQSQARAHQPLAQGEREIGQDSSVPGQGMETTRKDELRHEREVVRFEPDAARTGRQVGGQMPVSSYEGALSETKQAIQLSKPSIGTTRSVLEARRKKVNRRFWVLLIGLITVLLMVVFLLINEEETATNLVETMNDFSPILDLSASAKGQIIALCTDNGFKVFLNRKPFTTLNDMAPPSCKKVAVSKDGLHISIIDTSSKVWVWETKDNFSNQRLNFPGNARLIEWFGDNYLAIASEHTNTNIIRLFHKSVANQSMWTEEFNKKIPIQNVDYSRFRFLWSKSADQLWITDGNELWTGKYSVDSDFEARKHEFSTEQAYPVIDLFGDGLIASSRDGTLVYYSGDYSGEEFNKIIDLPEESSMLTAIASSPNDAIIAIGDDQGNLFILDVFGDNKALNPNAIYPGNKVDKLFWIGDGREVLVLLDNGRVRLHQLP